MYTNYYGFTTKPFQLTPDPRFFFGSGVHKRALAYLRYGINQAEGFIVITGDIGTGKTMLARNLFNELDSKNIIAAQLVTTQLEADDLLRMIVSAFGLSHDNLNKASLLKRFEEFLTACARNGKRILLVIDEAQNLPAHSLEELRMLSNYQISGTPLLQSFLLGQDNFRATLQAPEMEQLRQRIIASCHLTPLSLQETHDYIEHRLRVAGWRGFNPRLGNACYPLIHSYTQGIPRRVNIFCDRLLLYGFLEELQEFAEAEVLAVGKELEQEPINSSSDAFSATDQEKSLQPRPPVTPSPSTNADIEQRLSALEQLMASTTMEHGPQMMQLKRLEKRLEELDAIVSSLRRQTDNTDAGERSKVQRLGSPQS